MREATHSVVVGFVEGAPSDKIVSNDTVRSSSECGRSRSGRRGSGSHFSVTNVSSSLNSS